MAKWDILMDAVREVESNNGDPRYLVSKVGCKGPYQLADSTGQEWHAKLKIAEPYDPFNEQQSRKIASAYLSSLVKSFKGIELGLTAYNWGQGNLRKLIHFVGQSSLGALMGSRGSPSVKRMPKEAREYAPKVIAAFKRRMAKPQTVLQ